MSPKKPKIKMMCSQCRQYKRGIKVHNFGFGLILPACKGCVSKP